LFTANRWDWQPHRKLGAKYLVVLCASSTLLLVEDSLTRYRKRCPCWSVTRLASITFWSLAFSWIWHTLVSYWGKTTALLIIPSSWGSQLDGDSHQLYRNKHYFNLSNFFLFKARWRWLLYWVDCWERMKLIWNCFCAIRLDADRACGSVRDLQLY
jgi:hypothetical protein